MTALTYTDGAGVTNPAAELTRPRPPSAMSNTILIIDDEADIRAVLRHHLEKSGFTVREAESGTAGLRLSRDTAPDVILLDLMLPGIDGLEILRKLRAEARTQALRILIITAKSDETDRIVGLELGADDYVTKPFSPREVVARVKALLRREAPASPEHLVYGPLTLDLEGARVLVSGKPVAVTATEFKILKVLAEARGKVMNRERLLDLVWGVGYAITERTVDVHMKRLREKLGDGAEPLKTVRGLGYRLEA